MIVSEFSKAQIALACWRAAKTETHLVMLSVCQVFMNRAKAGWYDGDLYENCIRWLAEFPGEFPDLRDPQFQQLLTNLETVTSGMVQDKTDGALWFIPTNQIGKSLSSQFSVTTTIGGLSFIK